MNEIFHRTSIRNYLDRQIEQEKVEQLLRAAMAAPSAGNQQPWEYYVVINPSILKKLSKTSPYAGCTASFIACYRTTCKMPEYAQIDMTASVENLLLEADQLGLGAVQLGIAPLKERMEAVHNVLQISQDLVVFAIVPCGYPDALHSQQDCFDFKRVHYISSVTYQHILL